eukprot:ctg_6288.g525
MGRGEKRFGSWDSVAVPASRPALALRISGNTAGRGGGGGG